MKSLHNAKIFQNFFYTTKCFLNIGELKGKKRFDSKESNKLFWLEELSLQGKSIEEFINIIFTFSLFVKHTTEFHNTTIQCNYIYFCFHNIKRLAIYKLRFHTNWQTAHFYKTFNLIDILLTNGITVGL